MSKEAMKLALEAAYLAGWNASGEGYNAEYPFGDHARNPEEDAAWLKDRDNALREALAEQPAQQALDKMAENARELGLDYEPAQPQQKPVGTYSEIFESMRALLQSGRQADQQVYMAMQDKPLYASPQARQEPAAYWIPKAEQFCIADPSGRPFAKAWEPLYTTPQPAQRTWVGLTQQEVQEIHDTYHKRMGPQEFAAMVEAKLKEKNT